MAESTKHERIRSLLTNLPEFARHVGVSATPMRTGSLTAMIEAGALQFPVPPSRPDDDWFPPRRQASRATAHVTIYGPPPTSRALREWAKHTIPGRAWRRWSTARIRRMYRMAQAAEYASQFRAFTTAHDDAVDAVSFAFRSVGARMNAGLLRPVAVICVCDDPDSTEAP